MNVLMLVFALSAAGPETLAMAFPTMTACEDAHNAVRQTLADAGAVYVATACVVPMKVQGV